MTEDRIITRTAIPRDSTARAARRPRREVGTKLFVDDPAAAHDHGSFDGPTK
jgi:hypothetical protein